MAKRLISLSCQFKKDRLSAAFTVLTQNDQTGIIMVWNEPEEAVLYLLGGNNQLSPTLVCLSVSSITQKPADRFFRKLGRNDQSDLGIDPDWSLDPDIWPGWFTSCNTFLLLPQRAFKAFREMFYLIARVEVKASAAYSSLPGFFFINETESASRNAFLRVNPSEILPSSSCPFRRTKTNGAWRRAITANDSPGQQPHL